MIPDLQTIFATIDAHPETSQVLMTRSELDTIRGEMDRLRCEPPRYGTRRQDVEEACRVPSAEVYMPIEWGFSVDHVTLRPFGCGCAFPLLDTRDRDLLHDTFNGRITGSMVGRLILVVGKVEQ